MIHVTVANYYLYANDIKIRTHLFIELHHTSVVRIQYVSLFIPDNQVKSQHPVITKQM